jgi:DNA-binding transcriptional LysR family regulator
MKQYSLIDLESFKAVVEAGSYHLAAERLSTSSATVSRRINSLESALGVRLLNRTTRNLSLTEAGEQYLIDVNNILSDIESSEEKLIDGKTDIKGELRISAPLSFGIQKLSPILSDFLKTYPDISVNLQLEDSQTDLQAEGVDIGIRITNNIKDSTIVATPVCQIELAYVASPEYIKKYGKPKDIKDLEKHSFLEYTLDRLKIEQLSLKKKNRFSANNGEALRDAAVSGHGILAIPLFIIDKELKNGSLVTVLEDCVIKPQTLYIIRLSRHFTPNKVRVMIDFLKDAFLNNKAFL